MREQRKLWSTTQKAISFLPLEDFLSTFSCCIDINCPNHFWRMSRLEECDAWHNHRCCPFSDRCLGVRVKLGDYPRVFHGLSFLSLVQLFLPRGLKDDDQRTIVPFLDREDLGEFSDDHTLTSPPSWKEETWELN